jgi:hypothetical protein
VPPTVTVSGERLVGATLTAEVSGTSPTPDSYDFLWEVAVRGKDTWEPISGATSQSLTVTPDLAGRTIAVSVTPTKEGYVGYAVRSPQVQIAELLEFDVPPTVSVQGELKVGSTLTAEVSATSPTPDSYDYEWYLHLGGPDNYEKIAGATSRTFTVPPELAGRRIAAFVTPRKAGYVETGWLSPRVQIAELLTFDPGVTATISGRPEVGSTLTADEGSPSPEPDAYDYQWLLVTPKKDEPIRGATGKTFEVTSDYEGAQIRVVVYASKDGYEDASSTSPAVRITPPTVFAPGPTATISGAAKVGSTLTAEEGSPFPVPDSYEYQWLSDGEPITGANGKTFAVTGAHVGQSFAVTVTARKAGLPDASDTSRATETVDRRGFDAGPTATISGDALIGSVLTAGEGSPSPQPDSYLYQWYANGAAVTGATDRTFTLTTAQQGKSMTVRVTAVKDGFANASDTSGSTASVTAPNVAGGDLTAAVADSTVAASCTFSARTQRIDWRTKQPVVGATIKARAAEVRKALTPRKVASMTISCLVQPIGQPASAQFGPTFTANSAVLNRTRYVTGAAAPKYELCTTVSYRAKNGEGRTLEKCETP